MFLVKDDNIRIKFFNIYNCTTFSKECLLVIILQKFSLLWLLYYIPLLRDSRCGTMDMYLTLL